MLPHSRSAVVVPTAEPVGQPVVPLTLTGPMLVSLMRKHRVKIRDLKAKYGLTLKRIREVRETGLSGFAAEEWCYLITGQWPAPGWTFTTKK